MRSTLMTSPERVQKNRRSLESARLTGRLRQHKHCVATLETIVNLNVDALPLNRFLVEVDVPDENWSCRETITTPPIGWTAIPAGKVSLDLGENGLQRRSSALVLVPSVVVPEEYNVLVNSRHPHCSEIRAQKIRPWVWDGRMRCCQPHHSANVLTPRAADSALGNAGSISRYWPGCSGRCGDAK